jgi:hypothetical protein
VELFAAHAHAAPHLSQTPCSFTERFERCCERYGGSSS